MRSQSLQTIGLRAAIVLVVAIVVRTTQGATESVKAHHIAIDAEPRSSFSPTASSSLAAAQSRSGQLVYAQPRDAYAGSTSSGGYSTVGSAGGSASSSSYGAPASSSSSGAYGAPGSQNPQGSMTYYYYHYPAAAGGGGNGGWSGGETTGRLIYVF